jgi:hypothetical protein
MPHHDAQALLRSPHLIEALASVEHERWSHWQRHLHEQCVPGVDGSLTIPPDLVRRWATQMNTPYAQLPEQEKDSDREQVQRYLPIIAAALGVGGTTRGTV